MGVPVWAPSGSTRDPALEGQEEGLNRSVTEGAWETQQTSRLLPSDPHKA